MCGVCEVSIRTLEDLRGRCVIDDITGCWNWGGTYHGKLPTARVCAGVGGLQEKSRNMSAMRAAWILAGKDVAPGQNVYHAVGCKHSCSRSCVNPDHLAAGSALERNQAAAKRGAHNDVSRLATLAKLRAAHMLPADLVRNVSDAIHSDGLTCKQAAAKFGVREDMAKIIRRGQHAHQRAPVLRGASVFSFGG